MFDSSLLFTDATAVTTTGNSTALNINKTPADGVDVELCVTAVAGSTTGLTLDAVVHESADNSTYNAVTTFAQVAATGRWVRRVQSKKAYLRITYTVGAATGASFTLTAGIVSGSQRDQGA